MENVTMIENATIEFQGQTFVVTNVKITFAPPLVFGDETQSDEQAFAE